MAAVAQAAVEDHAEQTDPARLPVLAVPARAAGPAVDHRTLAGLIGNRALGRMLSRCACGGHAPGGGTCASCRAGEHEEEDELALLQRAAAVTRPARALSRCACGAHAPAGGTCSACASAAPAPGRSELDEWPEMTALRGAVLARRTLARACLPAAECATPHSSLQDFVKNTESKPENVSKAAKRQADCAAGKPACTADGHAAIATALTKLMQDRSPSRLNYVSGIFVNKDLPADYGAVTVDCATFVPALPQNGGNSYCTTVPASMEAEAKQYADPNIKTIGGVPRYTWWTRTLITLTHETEHGRFDSAADDPAKTPLSGPSTGTCRPEDVESDLSEMAAQMSEFPILLRRLQPFPDAIRKKRLQSWFHYHLNNGAEDVTGTLKSLRCRCDCADVDRYIKQVVNFAQAGWNSYEKWTYHTEMKDPSHNLNWPVDPPAAVDVNDLPSAVPTADVAEVDDMQAAVKAATAAGH